MAEFFTAGVIYMYDVFTNLIIRSRWPVKTGELTEEKSKAVVVSFGKEAGSAAW